MKHKLFLFTFLLAILSAINIQASERKKYNFNSEWKLRIGDFPKAKDTKFDDSKWKQVTLPHAFNEDEAFKLSIEQLTDTVVWYRKSFQIPELKSNQKVFVEFEGGNHERRSSFGFFVVAFGRRPAFPAAAGGTDSFLQCADGGLWPVADPGAGIGADKGPGGNADKNRACGAGRRRFALADPGLFRFALSDAG